MLQLDNRFNIQTLQNAQFIIDVNNSNDNLKKEVLESLNKQVSTLNKKIENGYQKLETNFINREKHMVEALTQQ